MQGFDCFVYADRFFVTEAAQNQRMMTVNGLQYIYCAPKEIDPQIETKEFVKMSCR
jgi:hypothetical protein